MAVGSVVAFWGVSLLFVLTPGADWAYAITAGVRYRSVGPAIVGLLTGHLVATALVAAGIAAAVSRSPVVLTVVTVAGAAYLVWLGITTVARPAPVQAAEIESAGSWAGQAGRGFGISGLNPKVLLLFLALLPQFTDAGGRWPLAVQIGLLGLLHTLSCAVVYTGVAFGARTVLAARPRLARLVSRFSGAAMVTIGAALLAQQVAT